MGLRSRITSRKSPVANSKDETPPESFASICSVLTVGLFCLTFVFQNFAIPSSSMASTLLVGDHVLVNRIAFGSPATRLLPYREVQRGDVVVFYNPTREPDGEELFLVKRVIGVPGDRIHLRAGVVYRNGHALQEPYAANPPYADVNLYRDDYPSVMPSPALGVSPEWVASMPGYLRDGDLVVPGGRYFVMGDNRSVSLDSRYWGFVPRANILGEPLLVYWSFPTPDDQMYKTALQDQAGFAVHELFHFFDETRWSRTFHIVR
jgi:signal peptidase I